VIDLSQLFVCFSWKIDGLMRMLKSLSLIEKRKNMTDIGLVERHKDKRRGRNSGFPTDRKRRREESRNFGYFKKGEEEKKKRRNFKKYLFLEEIFEKRIFENSSKSWFFQKNKFPSEISLAGLKKK